MVTVDVVVTIKVDISTLLTQLHIAMEALQ